MRRILIVLFAVLALGATQIGASASAAGSGSSDTATVAAKKKKSKVPRKCKRLKGTKRSRCIAKAKRCKRGYVKKYNKRKTKAYCRKKLPRPVAPKPPGVGQSVAPIDYSKIAGLSEVKYSTDDIERLQLEVPSHDGINMYIEVIKPKAPGKYPVIFEASGYHGTLYNRDGWRILPDPKGADGNPIGLVGYFVPRGYAVVMMDVRGTGKSEGCLDHLGQNDLKDIKAMLDWSGTQEWSNGRIGMTGHSYVGGTTNVGAAGGSQYLKTIIPSASLASMYDHQFQHGVPFLLQWAGPIIAYEELALFADLPPQLTPVTQGNPTGGAPSGDNFGNDPQYTGCGMQNSAAAAGDGEVTGQYEEFHAQRDHIEAVKNANIPIFLQHGTVDQAARIGGVTWMFERNLKPGDKLWIGQWDHGIGSAPTRRGMQWTYALHAWFDKHLAQRQVDTGPPLEVFLNDEASDEVAYTAQGQILAGSTAPQTKPFTMFARGEEGMADLPGEPGSVSFVGDARGINGNEQTGGATFQTKPFESDKLFFGVPQMLLNASVTNPQVHLIGTLFAVSEDAKRRRLTQCAMNPILRDAVDTVSPVVPSQAMELKPPCFAVAYQVRAGESLRLRVTTSDPDKVPMHSEDPRISVVFGGQNGTQITLPEVVDGKLYADAIVIEGEGDPNSGG